MDAAMQASRYAALRESLRRQGFVEGDNLVIEARWAEGKLERLPALAGELLAAKVEVLVTAAPPAVRAAMAATKSVPIVAVMHDPVSLGFASSYARPGGNFTGVAFQDSQLSTKRVELLRSVVPQLKRLAVVWNRSGGGQDSVDAVARAATALGLEMRAFEAAHAVDIVAAVDGARAWGAEGLVQLASPVITLHRKSLLEAIARHRLPATCELRIYVEEGCLMTYSADLDAMFVTLGRLTANVLKGARVADVPIEQPQEFEFVINQRTARSLNLSIPPSVMLQVTDTVR